MSGRLSGVQRRLQNGVPWALYIHCHAHRLNLAVVYTCKAVRYAGDFLSVLQQLYHFVTTSYVHPKWIAKQKHMYPNDTPIEF